MIIDAHCHLTMPGHRPQKYMDNSARTLSLKTGLPEEKIRVEWAKRYDPTGDALVQEMDEAGIDKGVICCIDMGLLVENDEPEVPIEEQNRQFSLATKRHPGRLLMAVGVDPRRPNAVHLMQKRVKEYGAKSIKLFPPAGFYPNDRIVYPIYEKAVELDIPVNFHTGPSYTSPTRSKFSHPIHLEDVAIDFPELRIHATHAGGAWWRDMLAIAENKNNIYIDLAMWQMRLREPLKLYLVLREMVDTLGADRVMFASDWAAPKVTPSLATWVNAIKNIPEAIREKGIDFTEAEKTAILGKTAARVLRLE